MIPVSSARRQDCDVAGSTALGERLGPERFKVMMDQLLGRLITAVSRYEGTMAQVMGDGLLAFFGAPLAHEDDPERALNAALEIRATVSAYARDLEAAYAVSIAVRVGLRDAVTSAIVAHGRSRAAVLQKEHAHYVDIICRGAVSTAQ